MIDFNKLAGELRQPQLDGAAVHDDAAAALGDVDPSKFGGRATAPSGGSSLPSPESFGGKISPVDVRNAVKTVADRSKTADEKFSLLKTVQNVPRSAIGQLDNLANVVLHPIQTAKGITAAAAGGIQKLIPGEQAQEPAFDSVVGFFKDRYGSGNALLKTIQEDPVGFATDVAGILTVAGAGIKAVGAAGEVSQASRAARIAGLAGDIGHAGIANAAINEVATGANAFTKAGQAISSLGEAVDPVARTVKAVGRGVEAVAAPFAKSARPDIVQKASEFGIDLPLSASTDSYLLRGAEALGSKGLFGGNIIENIASAREGITNIVKKTIEKIAPAGSEPGFSQFAAHDLANGIQLTHDVFMGVKNSLYEELLPKIGGQASNADHVEKALRELVSERSTRIVDAPVVAEVKGILEQIRNERTKSYGSTRAEQRKLPPFTYGDLKAARTHFGEKIGDIRRRLITGDESVYSKIYAALSEDMDAVVRNKAPEMKQKLSELNDSFKNGMSLYDSKVGKSVRKLIRDNNIGTIVDHLIQPKQIEVVRQAKRLVGNENVPLLQAAFMRKLLDESMVGGVISGNKLEKAVNRFGVPVVEELLTNKQMKKLDAATELAKAVETGTHVSHGSQTAFLTKIASYGGIALVNPAFLTKILMSEFAGNKILTSSLGKRWLTVGSKTGKAVAKAIRDSAKKAGQVNFVSQQIRAATQR